MKTFPAKIGRWLAELILVFIGAYAAFWLSNYQQHQQQATQRDHILASLAQELEAGIQGTRDDGARFDREARDFEAAVANGERPPLHRFVFTTDYNPGDIAALLQAGGIELLQVKTLTTLRNFETVVRWGLSRMAHDQKLSDELIAPALGSDPSVFYDESGRKLRERFDFYVEAMRDRAEFFKELQQKQAELLNEIKSERQRR